MLFHEVYSSYYRAVGNLIARAGSGQLSDVDAASIIGESAFQESFLYITDAVKNGQWMVLDPQWNSPLTSQPRRPLTVLERRWLAAVVNDRRMELFCSAEAVPTMGDEGDTWLTRIRAELADVEPLYRPEDFSVVDGVLQSDPYEDPTYGEHFRTVVKALREHRELVIAFKSGKGKLNRGRFRPVKLEYSEKEDRFRLLARRGRANYVINLARILKCTALWEDPVAGEAAKRAAGMMSERKAAVEAPKASVDLELVDQRGALERAMVQFADLEKVTKQVDQRRYTIRLTYRKADESEILIRILAFGPMIKVTGPNSFVKQIKERLERQRVLEKR